jgi:hypothetical protein
MKPLLIRPNLPGLSILVATLACACGGGGSGSAGSSSGPATLSISLADAASDKLDSFRVVVASIDLVRSNGTTVSALAVPKEVDLADLRDASELVNTLATTSGTFSSATITLDMSSARCVLVGKTTAATIQDDQGAAIGATLALPVQLGGPFALGASAHELIEIELDLDQSLQIDTTTNVVAFTPCFLVHTEPASQRPCGASGTLASVDSAASTFVVALEGVAGAAIDDVLCHTDGSTVFQIDGTPATGAAGLAALATASLVPGTWVQACGTPNGTSARIDVTEVLAGAGTWNGGNDVIVGQVTNRSAGAGGNPTLTIIGRSSNAAHSAYQYGATLSATTNFAGTFVTRLRSGTAFSTDDINVGQRVRVYGTLAGTSMNATAGVAHLEPTSVYGSASGAPAASRLTLNVSNVGLLGQASYTWASSGTTPPTITALVADVGTLADNQAIDTGVHVSLRGYFPSVSDTGADFVADSALNADTAPALLLVRNRLGSGFDVALTTVVSQLDGSLSVEIAITGSAGTGEVALVDQGLVGSSNLASSPTPSLVAGAATGVYTIHEQSTGWTSTYTTLGAFGGALTEILSFGEAIRHVGAVGVFDSIANTIAATSASVVIE